VFARAVLVWVLMSVVAVANGTLRVYVLVPAIGEASGHVASTVLLCAVILVLTRLTIGWIGARGTRDDFILGGLWLSMTLAFEFLAGHYLFGHSWERLLADYNPAAGRVWILVLIVTFLAPWIASGIRTAGRGGAG
jgi:hypothetical protein